MRITVKQAARVMGVSEQFIRVGLQRELLPIGTAINISGKRWTYYISPKLLEDYTGKKEPSAATDGKERGLAT